MRYFCLTHVPAPWALPAYMEQVSTVPVGEGVLHLGERYPELAGRGPLISEYATLFAVRRLLQESWPDGPPPGEMVGVSHYRRFAATQTFGRPDFAYGLVTPAEFAALPEDIFLPPAGTLLLPAPVQLNQPVVTQYGQAHRVRDLLHFMATAIDLGVVDNDAVAIFLGQPVMVPAPTVGVYPADWLLRTLVDLERVVDAYESGFAVEREGYQRRAVGFCTERLHALLTVGLVNSWPDGKVQFTRPIVVTDDQRYRDGG